MTLSGKVALVTGATSGIGAALTSMLRANGAQVVAVGRNRAKLDAYSNDPDIHPHAADVADADALESAFDAAQDRFGRIDIVCANAGVYLDGNIWENDAAQVSDLISTNVTAAMNTVRTAVRRLQGNGGDIIVTSSVAGHQAIEWEPVYSGSKHAIQSFVHGVRRQLVGSGIRIGSLAPGIVLNELWQRASPERADPEQLDRLADEGEGLRSSDVAEAARFMLTVPRNATIRDLVILPTNQDI